MRATSGLCRCQTCLEAVDTVGAGFMNVAPASQIAPSRGGKTQEMMCAGRASTLLRCRYGWVCRWAGTGVRAVVYEQYGPPDVLRIEDVPVPSPACAECRRLRSHSVT